MRLNEVAQALQKGKTITFNPTGNSMAPLINSGDPVTLAPAKIEDIKIGDIVLCKVGQALKLHLVDEQRGSWISKDIKLKIINAKGFVNGWTSTIYGKVVPTAFDEAILKHAKKQFIIEHWTLDSKITEVSYSEKGLYVNFLTPEALKRFKPISYKSIPLYKEVRRSGQTTT